MTDYSAEVYENGATVSAKYQSGNKYDVEISGGFVKIELNGETIADLYLYNLEDEPIKNWSNE